jgi:excisionase family DNA binding protein
MKRRMKQAQKPLPTPIAMSVRVAAQSTGVSRYTLLKAIADGKLPAKRLGRKFLVARVDLEAWLESLDDVQTTGAR